MVTLNGKHFLLLEFVNLSIFEIQLLTIALNSIKIMQNLKKDFLIYTAFLASKNIPYAQDVMFDQFEGVPNHTQDDMQYQEQIGTDQKLYLQVGQNFREKLN